MNNHTVERLMLNVKKINLRVEIFMLEFRHLKKLNLDLFFNCARHFFLSFTTPVFLTIQKFKFRKYILLNN